MPLSLKDLRNDERAITVKVGSGELRVKYRPNALNQKEWDSLHKTGYDSEWGPLFVEKAVISWDLMGDDGKPVPFTAEALAEVPTPVLLAVATSCRFDILPNPQTSKTSEDGS